MREEFVLTRWSGVVQTLCSSYPATLPCVSVRKPAREVCMRDVCIRAEGSQLPLSLPVSRIACCAYARWTVVRANA